MQKESDDTNWTLESIRPQDSPNDLKPEFVEYVRKNVHVVVDTEGAGGKRFNCEHLGRVAFYIAERDLVDDMVPFKYYDPDGKPIRMDGREFPDLKDLIQRQRPGKK